MIYEDAASRGNGFACGPSIYTHARKMSCVRRCTLLYVATKCELRSIAYRYMGRRRRQTYKNKKCWSVVSITSISYDRHTRRTECTKRGKVVVPTTEIAESCSPSLLLLQTTPYDKHHRHRRRTYSHLTPALRRVSNDGTPTQRHPPRTYVRGQPSAFCAPFP